ncbi:alpha/beta fold hydrolase [Mycolicibacterium litorale]|uniref:alpha/beta fold hydrolase n=1 Tax=Mycolicibacterium litorale TaxID=758802 RepID=UPI003CF87F8F
MQLNSYEWGDPDAPPVICVHGVGQHALTWRRVAEERWSKHFRVIAFDLRGHGGSGWNPPWTNATLAADLIASIDALEIERPHWVGLSLGGRLLLEMAVSNPDRIARAALLEPVIQTSPEVVLRRAQQELTGDVWDSVEAFLASRENTGHVDPKFFDEIAEQFEDLPDGRVRRRTCQPAIVSIFSEFAAPSPPPETLTVPAMILHAPAFGMVTADQLAAYRPYVEQIVEVPGLHNVLWTAFDRTADAVERFLLGTA